MNIEEIEGTALSDLSVAEFDHVALGIAMNSELELVRETIPELHFVMKDDDGFEFVISKNLTALEAFRLSQVITEGESHKFSDLFRCRPLYDRRRAAANDND